MPTSERRASREPLLLATVHSSSSWRPMPSFTCWFFSDLERCLSTPRADDLALVEHFEQLHHPRGVDTPSPYFEFSSFCPASAPARSARPASCRRRGTLRFERVTVRPIGIEVVVHRIGRDAIEDQVGGGVVADDDHQDREVARRSARCRRRGCRARPSPSPCRPASAAIRSSHFTLPAATSDSSAARIGSLMVLAVRTSYPPRSRRPRRA